jgi:hypothetical protein
MSRILFVLFFVLPVLGFSQTTIFSQYLGFNGNNITADGDYVQIADNPSLDFDASTSFTIQFWINPTNLNTAPGAVQGIVTKRAKGGIGYGVFWNVTAGGNGRFQLRLKDNDTPTNNSSNFRSTNINPANITTLGWSHLTFVLKRNASPAEDTAYVYFNGDLNRKSAVLNIDDLSNNRPLRFMSFF